MGVWTRPKGGRRSSDVWGWGRWGVWSSMLKGALPSAVCLLSSSVLGVPYGVKP